jgi:hypothetical protein
MTMKLTSILPPKASRVRILVGLLYIEVLPFLLPTGGKIEGHEAGYWDGVKLRLLSGSYWARALLGGIVAAVVLTAVIAFANYLGRFADPPREGGGRNRKA